VERKSKSDTGINMGDWTHLKIIRKIPEQHTGKARNQGTAENSRIEHCTNIAGSANVQVQNIFPGRNT
jgi:hypothetical protein